MKIKTTIKKQIRYQYYSCPQCGRRLIPTGNPSKCPHCGKVTYVR